MRLVKERAVRGIIILFWHDEHNDIAFLSIAFLTLFHCCSPPAHHRGQTFDVDVYYNGLLVSLVGHFDKRENPALRPTTYPDLKVLLFDYFHKVYHNVLTAHESLQDEVDFPRTFHFVALDPGRSGDAIAYLDDAGEPLVSINISHALRRKAGVSKGYTMIRKGVL